MGLPLGDGEKQVPGRMLALVAEVVGLGGPSDVVSVEWSRVLAGKVSITTDSAGEGL